MGIIEELENFKYRFIVDLIKNGEQYDKKKDVFTAKEAFEYCLKRYLLLEQLILPLEKKIGDNIKIIDIFFSNVMQDNLSVILKYIKNGSKLHMMAISNFDFQDLSVITSDQEIENSNFEEENREFILNIVNEIINNSLDEAITVKSTTGKFIIKDNGSTFVIKDSDEKMFTLTSRYSDYIKEPDMVKSSILECNIPKLKELLNNSDSILELYDHLHVYQEELCEKEEKKLTYR